MATDLRGFRYALESLRKRRQWQLDAALAQLAALRRRMADSEAARDALDRNAAEQSARAASTWTARADPIARTRSLAYLMQLQQQRAGIERQIVQLRDALAQAQAAVARRQQGLEMLQRHHKEELAMYRLGKDRKTGAEADQDWSARSAHAAGERA
ncbi:MAG: hypothetical protein V4864_11045 [Pseudomonadota bacterium]